jgi:hypothetical protein
MSRPNHIDACVCLGSLLDPGRKETDLISVIFVLGQEAPEAFLGVPPFQDPAELSSRQHHSYKKHIINLDHTLKKRET